MFPNDLWITDPNEGKQLYKIVDEQVIPQGLLPSTQSYGIQVSRDTQHVYITDVDDGKLNVFTNGAFMHSIPVGNKPYAVCEDGNGVVYVANYGDNTVTKIIGAFNDKFKTQTINVPSGPRALVSDSNNNIFVACYISNCVAKIVNDLVVDEIDCSLYPRAICCDPYDNIWVANYASNTVSKITKSIKVADLPLQDYGRGTVAIVSDSKGVIYAANYLGNNVVRIKATNSGNYEYTAIPVGAAPTTIDVTGDDIVYVNSEIDGTMTRIENGQVANSFFVCANPVAFGDFTGAAVNNVFSTGASSGGINIRPGGWQMGDMSPEVLNYLSQVKNGQVNTDASLVTYHSLSYPTVEAALDKVLNVAPKILSFSTPITLFETGSDITSLTVSWEFNKPMAAAEVRNGATIIANLADTEGAPVAIEGTKTISGFSITTNSTLILRATDEDGNVITKTLPLTFGHKFLFGSLELNPQATAITQSDLDALNKSVVLKDPYGLKIKLDCGATATKQPCIAIPSAWGINVDQILTNLGMFNDSWTKYTVVYTNASGGNTTYDAFVFDNPMVGVIIGEIVKFA